MHYTFPQLEMRNTCVSINNVNILFMIPDKGNNFSLRHHAQNGSGIQPAYVQYPVYTGNAIH
jgi:hypothetical protein